MSKAEALKFLEEEIENLKKELDRLQFLYQMLAGEIPEKKEEWNEIPIISKETREQLGTIKYTENEMIIIPLTKQITSSTEPFRRFFLNKVIPDEKRENPKLVLNLIQEGNRIKEIRIKNYGGEEGRARIYGAIRWTLEKMK